MTDETVIEDDEFVDDEEDTEDESIADATVKETDDLDSLDEVHAQAALNRAAIGPVMDDPTVVTAGTGGIAEPGPGPEPVPPGEHPGTRLVDSAGAPISVDEGDEGAEDDEEEVEQVESDYDPGLYTVAEVNEYIANHPEEADAVIAAEAAGKNRSGIVG